MLWAWHPYSEASYVLGVRCSKPLEGKIGESGSPWGIWGAEAPRSCYLRQQMCLTVVTDTKSLAGDRVKWVAVGLGKGWRS